MLTLPPSVRIFVCLEATDMRKEFDGLAATTLDVLKEDPLSGHLFVFFNRRRNRVKALFWDRTGLCIWYKRIEKGRFQLSLFDARRGCRAEIESAELARKTKGKMRHSDPASGGISLEIDSLIRIRLVRC